MIGHRGGVCRVHRHQAQRGVVYDEQHDKHGGERDDRPPSALLSPAHDRPSFHHPSTDAVCHQCTSLCTRALLSTMWPSASTTILAMTQTCLRCTTVLRRRLGSRKSSPRNTWTNTRRSAPVAR